LDSTLKRYTALHKIPVLLSLCFAVPVERIWDLIGRFSTCWTWKITSRGANKGCTLYWLWQPHCWW